MDNRDTEVVEEEISSGAEEQEPKTDNRRRGRGRGRGRGRRGRRGRGGRGRGRRPRGNRDGNDDDGDDKADRGGKSRGRGVGRRQRRGGRGGGVTNYKLGSRVIALWADESKYYRATISSVSYQGIYGIVFDITNDREFKAYENQIQPLKYYTYEIGQQVKAYFYRDDRWYDGEIKEVLEGDRYNITFKHLTKTFTQRSEQLRPILEKGTRVLALWFKESKYMPATIEGIDDQSYYIIKFDQKTSEFPGTRPDNIIKLDTFEVDEEVLALWGQDRLYYPATIVGMDDKAKDVFLIKFKGYNKEFKARSHTMKKLVEEVPKKKNLSENQQQ